MTRIVLQSLILIGLTVIAPAVAAAQWTAVGSNGTVDDASKDIFDTTTSTLQILDSAPLPATLDARYNVVNVEGVTGAGGIVMSVRYRDNSGGARVLARLREVSLATGVNTVLLTVDSDLFPTSSDFQVRTDGDCPLSLNFANNAYYVDVRLFRSSAGAAPALQSLRVLTALCKATED